MSSSSQSPKPDVTLSLKLPSPASSQPFMPEERGIKLIQLLLTCASHTSSGNLNRADSCLRRISQLASVSGDSMQRLATRFAAALAIRVIKRWPGLYKTLNHSGPTLEDLNRARSIFSHSFPFMGFAYGVITQTLVQSMSWDRVIHLIDLGSGDESLWVPLLRNLANGPVGPPHVKITCVGANKLLLDELGRSLVKEAGILNMSFQFNPVNVTLGDLTRDMLKAQPGEALAFVSILNLHVLLAEDDHVSQFGVNKSTNDIKENKKMDEFLAMVWSMSPKLVLVVEQESDHNLNRLVDRLVEGLHYYSAVFDSIDTAFGGSSCKDRMALEQMFGKEIENVVACEGLERVERHERSAKWAARFHRARFRPVNIWYDTTEDVKQIVETRGQVGFKVVTQRPSLMLCWHDRPIYALSGWTL